MTASAPILSSDGKGIWRRDPPGKRFGYSWPEVYRLIGYKLDTVTAVDTVLEVEVEYGEFLELNSEWVGFEEVLSRITAHLPGIDPLWYDRVRALTESDEPLVVWRRPVPSAPAKGPIRKTGA